MIINYEEKANWDLLFNSSWVLDNYKDVRSEEQHFSRDANAFIYAMETEFEKDSAAARYFVIEMLINGQDEHLQALD